MANELTTAGEFTDNLGRTCCVTSILGFHGSTPLLWTPQDPDFQNALRVAPGPSPGGQEAAQEAVSPRRESTVLDGYPDVLIAQEVADYLRVTPRQVYSYIDRGAIYAFQLEDANGNLLKRKYIPKQALLDYLEGNR